MNSLVQSGKFTKCWLKNATPSLTAIRNHWNKDYKPASYPLTQEERAAAAAKYGIPLAEYQPYPDDGSGAGDYPKMPLESAESKDPFYPWDNPELKRNFNEPLHVDFDVVREDRYNVNQRLHQPLWVLWLQFLSAMGGSFLLFQLAEYIKMFPAVVPPQIPKDGKVHYTFDSP